MALALKQEDFFQTLRRCRLHREQVAKVREFLAAHDYAVSDAELVVELQKLDVSYAQQLELFTTLGLPEKTALDLLSGVERRQQGIGSTHYKIIVDD